jgi:NAD(P)-dependent dehydrogenase (short-subunit alcohol dehydrogenase family)
MNTARTFAGKVVIVTGASSGIGQVAALEFARASAMVVAAARRADLGERTVTRIIEEGGDALFVQTDVSRPREVEALVAAAVARYGQLDCAFNNAGIGARGVPLHEIPDEEWDEVLGTNLTGVWLCMKYEIREMLRHGGGAIVNHASIAGVSGFPDIPAYVASKHGVVGLTRVAALSYAQQGIRVNAVCPAYIRTPLTLGDTPDPTWEAQLAAVQPVGRMGHPEEVVAAALWLCSDAASFVTGAIMPVDGGFTAR